MTRLRRWAARGLIALGVLMLVVTFTPLVSWVAAKLSYRWTDSDGDILIVLASDSVELSTDTGEMEMIGMSSYWRSIVAAWTWRGSHFKTVVISGQGASQEMKRFLIAYGVPEAAIQTENRSRSTRENALYTQEMLRNTPGKMVLLTSDFHMYRAAKTFQRAGLDVAPRPFGDIVKRSSSWTGRWECFWIELTELSKIAYYRYQGWI